MWEGGKEEGLCAAISNFSKVCVRGKWRASEKMGTPPLSFTRDLFTDFCFFVEKRSNDRFGDFCFCENGKGYPAVVIAGIRYSYKLSADCKRDTR